MAGRTTRFAFNKFGGGVAGTLTDDGGKFTGIDRDVIDRILAAYETHEHKGGGRLADPTDRPTLNLDTTTGTLPAARTLFYRVSFVDRFGLETKASPEYSVTTPFPLQPPGAPSGTTVAGGAVRPGITYYALSFHQGSTETDLGAATMITVSSAITPPETMARRTVVLTFPAVPLGVTAVSVWRQGATEGGFTRVIDLPRDPSSTTAMAPWTDDGSTPPDDCPTDPTHRPTGVNLTNSSNSVTITTPHQSFVTASPSDVKRWRIYRSGHSGVYSSKSLLAEIFQTVNADGSGGLIPSFIDTGSVPLTTGIPLDVSQTLSPSVALLNSASGAITMLAPSGAAWRLVASVGGAVTTTSSEMAITAGRLLLTDSTGVVWVVGVSDIGQIDTGVSAPSDIDVVFPYGHGPSLPTPDATLSYQLSIDTDGLLITTGIGTGLGGVGGGPGGGEGEPGPAGPPGPPGIYSGTWDSSRYYALGETVFYDDGSWVVSAAEGSVVGVAPDADSDHWQQVSAPGTGPAGPPGPTGPAGVYVGDWDSGTTYNFAETVSYALGSWVCTNVAGSTAGLAPDADLSNWQQVSAPGSGPIGPVGPPGPPGIYVGDWDGGTTYNLGETVAYNLGSWVCTAAGGSIAGTPPDADPTDWQLVSAPGSGPVGPPGPIAIYVGPTAPDPADFPLWLDTTT